MTSTTSQASADQSLESIPLADTFDEATLRRVFPDAPGSVAVPRDVRSMFSARMRSFGGEQRTIWLMAWIAALAIGAVIALAGSLVAGGIVAGLAVLAAVGIAAWQYSKAADDFFDLYARARGLHHHEDSHIRANVPLFDRGDERTWPRVLTGTIAGQEARLGHYTYTEVSHDSEGDRQETDYDFTVLHFTLPLAVAQRFAGVYCSPRKLSLGALQDKLAHDRKVELESSEFQARYTLRVVDSQDDVALYELFSTTFLHRLATELEVHWEQRGADLVVWRKGHEGEAADLDRFCLEAWHVLHRYLEEHR